MSRGLLILAVLCALLIGGVYFRSLGSAGNAEADPGTPSIGGHPVPARSDSDLESGPVWSLVVNPNASGEPRRTAAESAGGSHAGTFVVEVVDPVGRAVAGERVTLAFERRTQPGIGLQVASGFTDAEGLVELPCTPTTNLSSRDDWGARAWVGVSRLPRVGELEFNGGVPSGSRHRIELPHASELALDVGLPPGVDPGARLTARLWPLAGGARGPSPPASSSCPLRGRRLQGWSPGDRTA